MYLSTRALALTGLATLAALTSGCSDKVTVLGGLMVVFRTDGTLAPDALHIDVTSPDGATTFRHADYRIPAEAKLPASLAVASNGRATASVAISASVWQGGHALDQRTNLVYEVPTDRVAELDIVFGAKCSARVNVVNGVPVSTCAPSFTCDPATGTCVPDAVDAATLQTAGADGGHASGASSGSSGASSGGDGAAGASAEGGEDGEGGELAPEAGDATDAAPAIDAAGLCATVPPCDSDPTGSWEVSAACFAFPSTSPCPALLTASSDMPGGIALRLPVALGSVGASLRAGHLTLGADNTYDYSFSPAESGAAHFMPTCLQAPVPGQTVSCDVLGVALAAAFAATPGFTSACRTASDGGCDCTYGGALPASEAHGTWTRLGSETVQLDNGAEFDFCQRGTELDLTGDLDLIKDPPGGDPFGFGIVDLRALELTRASGADAGAPASESRQLAAPEATETCPSVVGCAGDPTGLWRIVPPGADAAAAGDLCFTTPPVTREQAPCADLIYLPGSLGGGPVQKVRLAAGSGVETDAVLSLRADHTYEIVIASSESDQVHFEPYCLTAYGAKPTCDDLAQGVRGYTNQGFDCTSAAGGGCDCSYLVLQEVADKGTWKSSGSQLVFASDLSIDCPVVETSFCATPSELRIQTSAGWNLFGDGPGTLTFEKGQ